MFGFKTAGRLIKNSIFNFQLRCNFFNTKVMKNRCLFPSQAKTGSSFKVVTLVYVIKTNGTFGKAPRVSLTELSLRVGCCILIFLIYVPGGCSDCWNNGLIEEYNLATDTWTKLNAPGPNVTFDKRDGVIAHLCGYADGYIYTVFGYTDEEFKLHMDRRFHVFDLKEGTWSSSDTELQVEAYWPVAAVLP